MSKDYTATLNLPQTDFAMRANLPQREPEMQKYWEEIGLYRLMLEKNAGKKQFLLHDGPPFSNGDIHMGHALNKILKDIIVKTKTMEGFYAPYIPGWDNHGMPIESAIIKKNRLNRKSMSIPEFRAACEKFARDFVVRQSEQFKRLGVTGDFDHPYVTMAPKFEEREVRVFGEMFRRGYIYKGLKPVYWCPFDETALAEAEIEYS
ncbi:MAG: class I tRNA ligase family protein, partial [Clostridia bacterium]|nr:class I tRNA ligase family protein [Clostridia bacterium]